MIRDIQPIDEDFVYHSWLRSVKCPTRMVQDMTRRVIDHVVERRDVEIFCPDDDPDHIIGWLAHGQLEDTNLIHFMFVKKDFRKNGIANDLVRHVYPDLTSALFCTYWSFHMQELNARRKWGAKFISNLLPTVVYDIMSKEIRELEAKCG
tara:strand:- start:1312 stop:1761 length:450 start_codon:yes stop_codon:yes gene_type:complete